MEGGKINGNIFRRILDCPATPGISSAVSIVPAVPAGSRRFGLHMDGGWFRRFHDHRRMGDLLFLHLQHPVKGHLYSQAEEFLYNPFQQFVNARLQKDVPAAILKADCQEVFL